MTQAILDPIVWGGAGTAHAFSRRWPSEKRPRPICGARRYNPVPCTPLGPRSRACLRCAQIAGHTLPKKLRQRIAALNAELRTLHARARRGALTKS